MDTTSKAQVVLPAVYKAIEEVSKLSSIYEEYANDLRVSFVVDNVVVKSLYFAMIQDNWDGNSTNRIS